MKNAKLTFRKSQIQNHLVREDYFNPQKESLLKYKTHNTISTILPNFKKIITKFLFGFFLLWFTSASYSQTAQVQSTRTFDYNSLGSFYTDYDGVDNMQITFSQLPNTPTGGNPTRWTNGCRLDDNNTGIFNPCDNTNLILWEDPISFFNDRLNSNLFGNGMMELEANETYNFLFEATRSGNGMYDNRDIFYQININVTYEDADGNSIEERILDEANIFAPAGNSISVPLEWTAGQGSRIGAISLIIIGDIFGVTESGGANVILESIPFYVKGPTTAEVPIIETVRTPIIPQTIIYDPPGDGSFSTFNTSTEFCREYSTSVATDMGFSANAEATIGVSTSVGLIATVDVEAGVTLSGGFGMSTSRTSENSFETCLEISQEFQTSALPGASGLDADLIIGVSQLQHLAVGDYVRLDPSIDKPILDKQLYIWPEAGEATLSIMTEELIQQDITALQAVVDAGPVASDDETVEKAANQIDVWNQVLALKANNEANAAQETNFPVPVGSVINNEQKFTTTQNVMINYETVVDANVGLEAFASVGGSGASASFEMSWQDTKGSGTSTANGMAEIISYSVTDDDDNLSVDVFRDPTFGTPILRLDPNTATSCPYEGGIRRDQPSLTSDLCIGQSIQTENLFLETENITDAVNPVLNVCNDSDEARNYTVRLIQNFANANVLLNGAVLGLNTNVTYNSILAGGCVEDGQGNKPILTITRNPMAPTDMAFLKFVIYPSCFGDNLTLDEVQEFTIDISFGTDDGNSPANICQDANPITIGTVSCSAPVNAEIDLCITDSGEINPLCGGSVFEGIWYTFDAPASGELIIETSDDGSGTFDTAMALYAGSCGNLTQIDCNDDFVGTFYSQIDVDGLIPGETLYLRIWEFQSGNFGSFDLCVFDPNANACPPSLDLNGTQSTNQVYVSGSYITSDQVITSPSQVDYDATSEINLEEGFDVQSGAVFHAFINGCGNNSLNQPSESID